MKNWKKLAPRNRSQRENMGVETKGALIARIVRLEKINADLAKENERLNELATKDTLTGLYNRRGFKEEIAHIAPGEENAKEKRHPKKSNPAAILLLDIDDFKKINDAYGHRAGDGILKQAADFLKRISRKSDVVCRRGGEEFIVAFQGIEAKQVIQKFFNKGEKKPKLVLRP